ncbi:lysine decarboxylase superfamily protein [Mycolicibacterium fortuitum]|uniref:Lysine decarboxylase superfamily protein n=1 Tax=Mycolicibacterium fortuitum TaxID=1766 RepID=A0A378UV87_MYCFO|nr:lysine decarboxylase superfamily protein [Mycolicibacterium fortuitum]
MNICVFLSAADLDERYTEPARAFAELVGKGDTPSSGVAPTRA